MGPNYNFGFSMREVVLDLIWVFLISNMGLGFNFGFLIRGIVIDLIWVFVFQI